MVTMKQAIQKACELDKLKGVGIIIDAMDANCMAIEQSRSALVMVKQIDEGLSLDLLDAIGALDKLICEAREKVRQRVREVAGANDEQE